jgi:hypothetical protein
MKKKKNKLILISSCLLAILFFSGCKKDNDKNECRLVFATNTDPSGSQDFRFHYNDRGLADEWEVENFGLQKQEYDESGKLKKTTLIRNGTVIWIADFLYEGGDKVTKEIGYNSTGTDTTEVVYYYYNAQRKIVKIQSIINDWIATAAYTPEGNLSASELFFSGVPVYSAFFTYDKHFKNPYLAVPGIDHAFYAYTSAELFSSRWLYASLKQVGYDEKGSPTVLLEYDPKKTTWLPGPGDYPDSVTYFDLVSNTPVPFTYKFENCGGGKGNDGSSKRTAGPQATSDLMKSDPARLLRRNPGRSMKEQVKEFRELIKHWRN